MKKNSKGAVRTAVQIIAVAATATQNVPYLGAISSVLAEVMKVYDVREAIRCPDEGAYFAIGSWCIQD